MLQIAEEGRFRFEFYEWGVQPSNTTQSVAFSYRAIVLGKYAPDGTYTPHEGDATESTGSVWFIRRTGLPDDTTVEFLRQLLNWDGTAAQLLIPPTEEGAIKPRQFIGIVKIDDYRSAKGEKEYRIDRIEGSSGIIAHPTGARRASLAERIQAALDGRVLPVEPGGDPPGPTQDSGDSDVSPF